MHDFGAKLFNMAPLVECGVGIDEKYILEPANAKRTDIQLLRSKSIKKPQDRGDVQNKQTYRRLNSRGLGQRYDENTRGKGQGGEKMQH